MTAISEIYPDLTKCFLTCQSSINISPKFLNHLFRQLLESYQYDIQFKDKLQQALYNILEKKLQDRIIDEKANKKRISEIKGTIDKLEERFVLDEITKEQYQKFLKKFQEDINVLEKECADMSSSSSNLQKAITRGLEIAENIGVLWESSSFESKQKLQYLVFPEGVTYDKKNSKVRTIRVNSLFAAIPLLARDMEKKKTKKIMKNSLLASNVENSGFEPLQMWYKVVQWSSAESIDNTGLC